MSSVLIGSMVLGFIIVVFVLLLVRSVFQEEAKCDKVKSKLFDLICSGRRTSSHKRLYSIYQLGKKDGEQIQKRLLSKEYVT